MSDSFIFTCLPLFQDDVLVLMAAQFYYIDHQSDVTFQKLEPFVQNFLAEDPVRVNQVAFFVEKVSCH